MTKRSRTMYEHVRDDRSFYQQWFELYKKDEKIPGMRPIIKQTERVMIELNKLEKIFERM